VQDVRSGTNRQFPGLAEEYGPDPQGTLAWTPDSRSLIMLLEGRISILDVHDGGVQTSVARLGDLQQLTLRAPTAAR
jgi:hypothetical protein